MNEKMESRILPEESIYGADLPEMERILHVLESRVEALREKYRDSAKSIAITTAILSSTVWEGLKASRAYGKSAASGGCRRQKPPPFKSSMTRSGFALSVHF